MASQAEKDKLYRRFKGGDGDALVELLESERAGLYDYLMRMTGQVTRSVETVDEVYAALTEETLETISSGVELRICLYTTARKFNADIWNANTTRLVNAALEPPPSGPPGHAAPPLDERALRERTALSLLDRALRSLPGPEREAVCLKARTGFTPSEVAEIMGLGTKEVETRLTTGMKRIDAECEAGGHHASSALHRLPSHPPPLRSSQRTMNLSMVMQGIKTRPVGLWSPLRLVLVLLLLALVAVYLFWPATFARLLELSHWRSLGGSRG